MAELKAVFSFTDYQRLILVMRQINPKMVRSFRKRQREVGQELVSGIQDSIGAAKVHRGMVTKVGRLSWSMNKNQSVDVKSVVIRDRKRKPRSKYPIIGIIQASTLSAPVAIYDMAGRSGAYINKYSETREYKYTGPSKTPGSRKHKINGQGRRMIEMLGKKASRYVYPGAEKHLPAVQNKMRAVVNDAVNEINSMLRKP
jgi:hypothetical protein